MDPFQVDYVPLCNVAQDFLATSASRRTQKAPCSRSLFNLADWGIQVSTLDVVLVDELE